MRFSMAGVQRALLHFVFGLMVFAGVPAVAGQWCVTSECPGCASRGLGSGHGKECFTSSVACESRLSEVMNEPHGGVTYSSCAEEGGGAAGTAAAPVTAGHEMDPYITKAINYGINGDISASDAVGLVGMGLLGNALLAPKDPAKEAADRMAAAQAAAAAAQRQAEEEEARKNRLLGGMMDVDSAPLTPAATAAGGNDLGLMLDDEPVARSGNDFSFMPNRNAARVPNPEPPAVRVNPGPYTPPQSGQGLGLMLGDDPVPLQQKQPDPPPQDQPDPTRDDAAFNKGFVDGSQCYSASAGNFCSVAQGNIHTVCISSYEAGYRQGEGIKGVLLEQARQAGQLDVQQGRRNGSFTHPSAQGPCRTQWIESYNGGFNNVPAPRMGR